MDPLSLLCRLATIMPQRTGPYRPWAELLKITFGVDVLECPTCQGRMTATRRPTSRFSEPCGNADAIS
jgi:hypothetical protein